ncbi:MAG: ABC transporter ATP-binding protein/permease [Gammaproteobacteria bacterium]|nr:ABC transporter ATP-binding protein/permease [Gammaproteobacteria bacterium]NNC67169.1 ABC transporter ATP-binding protein/permease [Gammaproteobacteria bacterium]
MQFHARTEEPHKQRTDFKNLLRMFPYVWAYRWRVLIALACLVIAKVATVAVPLILKRIVDSLDVEASLLLLPLGLLLAYGALRLTTALFNELRDVLFARVRYRAIQKLSTRVLEHLHNLSLRFHIERQTGSITRDLERGTQSLSSIINYMVFIIVPTFVELGLVAAILLSAYALKFSVATLITIILYIGFTLLVTNWRMKYRHEMNRLDSQANSIAVDSLLNYETVKYFNNERYELSRYGETLSQWENAAVKSITTMSMLNFGQAFIIAIGVTIIMIFAAGGVADGNMTLGDLVLVNALMLQLFVPLNTLGIVYRQITYSLADMDMLVKLLQKDTEIKDAPNAKPLKISAAQIEFDKVSFSYNQDREILRDVSITIPSGHKVAVVGPSGAGKSTIARLLFRFYDVSEGAVRIDGQDVRECTQQSLHENIAVVPQDTVLFNESIYFNIQYAKPGASKEEIEQAAKLANIHDFIEQLPQQYETIVGERGLKLSGGEKQRVAIARAVLKNPRIVIFDEATSSLDSQSESMILNAMQEVTQGVTTLVIAHRLSTIVDADSIYVFDHGRVVESGSHRELLAQQGIYANMWALQQEERIAQDLESADKAAELKV